MPAQHNSVSLLNCMSAVFMLSHDDNMHNTDLSVCRNPLANTAVHLIVSGSFLYNLLCDLSLIFHVEVYPRPVLGACVPSLPVQQCRVMLLQKYLDQLFVVCFIGIIGYLQYTTSHI